MLSGSQVNAGFVKLSWDGFLNKAEDVHNVYPWNLPDGDVPLSFSVYIDEGQQDVHDLPSQATFTPDFVELTMAGRAATVSAPTLRLFNDQSQPVFSDYVYFGGDVSLGGVTSPYAIAFHLESDYFTPLGNNALASELSSGEVIGYQTPYFAAPIPSGYLSNWIPVGSIVERTVVEELPTGAIAGGGIGLAGNSDPEPVFFNGYDESDPSAGGFSIDLPAITSHSVLSASYSQLDPSSVSLPATFSVPGDTLQSWAIDFDNSALTDSAILRFVYDESLIGDTLETELVILHTFSDGSGSSIVAPSFIDTDKNIITIEVDRFSTFSLGTSTGVMEPVPEPSSLALLGMGAVGLAAARRRRRLSSESA